jgi:hypothetical protein
VFHASLAVDAPSSSYPSNIFNGDGGKYPKLISKGELLVEVWTTLL